MLRMVFTVMQRHMTLPPRVKSFRSGLAASGSALCLLLGLTQAHADSCAAYGPGFTRVEGGTGCMRFDGHVRVDDGNLHASSLSGWNSHGAHPASLHSGGDEGDGFDLSHSRVRLRPGLMGYAGATTMR